MSKVIAGMDWQELYSFASTPVASAVKQVTYEEDISLLDEVGRQNWSEIDGIYEACATSVVGMATGVNQALDTIRPYQSLLPQSTLSELGILVKGFNNDIETFTRKLVGLKQLHAGKSGPVRDGEDLILCLGVFEQYVAFDTEFRALTFPTMLNITEHIGTLMQKLKASQTQEPQPTEIPAVQTV